MHRMLGGKADFSSYGNELSDCDAYDPLAWSAGGLRTGPRCELDKIYRLWPAPAVPRLKR